jgi:hypothetical protein
MLISLSSKDRFWADGDVEGWASAGNDTNLDRGFVMARYIVSTEQQMLDVVERLLVERGVVIVARDEMFDTLVVETNDPLTVSQIEGVLEIRAVP